jgi:hypothetical protein
MPLLTELGTDSFVHYKDAAPNNNGYIFIENALAASAF